MPFPDHVVRQLAGVPAAFGGRQAEVRRHGDHPALRRTKRHRDEPPAHRSSLPGQVRDVRSGHVPGRSEQHGVADAVEATVCRSDLHVQRTGEAANRSLGTALLQQHQIRRQGPQRLGHGFDTRPEPVDVERHHAQSHGRERYRDRATRW